MIKNYDFHCPYCNCVLNKDNTISLKTRRDNGEEGEIRLDTAVGNYEYTHHPTVIFEPGELVDFICSECNKSLVSSEFNNYALLKMKVKENIEFEVLFSRMAGIQKTYIITEDGIESYSGN